MEGPQLALPGCVGGGREAEQEVQFCRIDLLLHQENLERHLCGENQLVALEETSGGVHEHRVRHAVGQIGHPAITD